VLRNAAAATALPDFGRGAMRFERSNYSSIG